MSFSIGATGPSMGPRGAIEGFGDGADEGGRAFDRHLVIRLLAYLRPYSQRMAAAFGLTLATTALSLVSPYLTKVAIDRYIAQGDASSLARIASLMIAVLVALFLASAGQQYLLSWVGQRVLAALRDQLFRHLQDLSVGYHDTHIVGVTISRVINDVAVINELLSEGWITLIGNTLILAGIVIVMLSMNVRLALLSLCVIPLMLLATYLFSRRAKVAFRQTRTSVAAVVGDLAEGIQGMRVIQAFAQEEQSQARFDQVNLANRQAHVDALSLSFIFLPSIEFLGMLATCVVLWFGDFSPRPVPALWPALRRRYEMIGVRIEDPWERNLPSGECMTAVDPTSGELLVLDTSSAASRRPASKATSPAVDESPNRVCPGLLFSRTNAANSSAFSKYWLSW